MFEVFSNAVKEVNSFLWGAPLIILLVGVHLYMTFRLKFIQRYIPLGIKLSIAKDNDSNGEISQFGALAIALAATIGTGNIIGVATAIVSGGPGAVFWCWLCGIFGIATKYAESLLSIKYRIKDADGKPHGGPMYAIERGMGIKWLAVLFAIFTVLASFGLGNLTQSNAVAKFTEKTFHLSEYWTGAIVMILIALVVIGGVQWISRLCSVLVPFMAVIYVIGCVIVLCLCAGTVFPAIKLIVTEAFSARAITGGFFGSMIMLAMRYGIARGLFSNESGLGSAPIVAASAKTRNPVRQALISSTGTFWDTVCVCALTGITLVAAVLKFNPNVNFMKDFDADNADVLAEIAFNNIPKCGLILLTIALVIFAMTTILGWFCYGEQAIHYLGGRKAMLSYRLIFVAFIYLGAISKLDLVWNLSDIANGLMAIPNIICIFALSGIVVAETKRYLKDGSIDDYADELIDK